MMLTNVQKKIVKMFFVVLLLTWVTDCNCADHDQASYYVEIVKKFADTLLEKGRDVYGEKKTALWCGVINVENYVVPRTAKEVPELPGVRAKDRSVGGCNLYQDVSTLYTFVALSKITGDSRYETAVDDYIRDYLRLAQHEKTGHIAWGEHLYYDVFKDRVSGPPFHEMLGWTPPWDLMWKVDSQAVTREIEALKYHFCAEDPATEDWLFCRHSIWNKAQYASTDFKSRLRSMPWIKHAGLYAFSYSYLHNKTPQQEFKRRAVGIGSLYWNNRNTETNLSVSCLRMPASDPPAHRTSMSNFTLMTYFLLKAAHIDATNSLARDQAVTMLTSFLKHSWNEKTQNYREVLFPDGKPESENEIASNPWLCSYTSSGLARFGRTVAYAAKTENNAKCREAAIRVAGLLKAAPLPDKFTPEEVGMGIHLFLDVYDLTQDSRYLEQANATAKIALEGLWAGGLFRRTKGDSFYEAKLGVGDLTSALLRLSLRLEAKPDPVGIYDWSF